MSNMQDILDKINSTENRLIIIETKLMEYEKWIKYGILAILGIFGIDASGVIQ